MRLGIKSASGFDAQFCCVFPQVKIYNNNKNVARLSDYENVKVSDYQSHLDSKQ